MAERGSRVAVVIVNWNGKQDTLDCLVSLRSTLDPSVRVVVVENGSTQDGLQESDVAAFGVELIVSPVNLGFGRGNNLAIDNLDAVDYCLLLNSDTLIVRDFVQDLVAYADAHPHVGALGPLITDFSTKKIQSAGATLSRILLNSQVIKSEHLDSRSPPYDVDYLSGAALLLRMHAIREVGAFDPDFFLYEEEVDLCLRMRDAGWAVRCLPVAGVLHKESAATRKISGFKDYHRTKSRIFLLRKRHSGAWKYMAIPSFVVQQASRRLASFLLRRIDSRELAYTFRGLREGLRSPIHGK